MCDCGNISWMDAIDCPKCGKIFDEGKKKLSCPACGAIRQMDIIDISGEPPIVVGEPNCKLCGYVFPTS